MGTPEWDSNLRSVRQHLIELRRLAVEASCEVVEARIAAKAAITASLELIAEADRVLARNWPRAIFANSGH